MKLVPHNSFGHAEFNFCRRRPRRLRLGSAHAALATAYLVLASQRSGSTLLVESLRATGVAGEPQEFFQYLPDHQHVAAAPGVVRRRRGRVDPAAARSARSRASRTWPRRDLAGLHPHRRPHPQRHLGRQADVEPDASAAQPGQGPPRTVRSRACCPPSATSSAATRC